MVALALPLAGEPTGAAAASGGCILEVHLAGIVNAGSGAHLRDAIAAAERQRCDAVLMVVDTPGGMLDETRDIVSSMLTARVPILVHVAPAGARAGSAGAFIAMAAHVVAMAPGSTIGAAHPVVGMGSDPEQAGGKHMAAKVENDTAAFARSIAEQRGRNLQWAELAVRESASATAREALELGVIDHVVGTTSELLAAVDGTVVKLDGRELTLSLGQSALVPFEPTIQQRALEVLGDPNLAYALLMLGILGLVVEVQNPGLIFPGATGAFCLLLAAIGLNLLPVNLGAIALLAVAAGLLVLEMYVTSFGLLTAAALGCLLLGSSLLIDEADPRFFADADVRLGWGAVLPLALLLCGGSLALATTAARLRGKRAPAGAEGLLGELGETLEAVAPDAGAVRIHGERWNARAEVPIAAGTRVRVVGVDGLELRVTEASMADAVREEGP